MNSHIYRKSQDRCFGWLSAAICAPQMDTNMASPKCIYIPNISHMKYRTDLILGEDFHFQDSGLSVLNGLLFYFDGVTVKNKRE